MLQTEQPANAGDIEPRWKVSSIEALAARMQAVSLKTDNLEDALEKLRLLSTFLKLEPGSEVMDLIGHLTTSEQPDLNRVKEVRQVTEGSFEFKVSSLGTALVRSANFKPGNFGSLMSVGITQDDGSFTVTATFDHNVSPHSPRAEEKLGFLERCQIKLRDLEYYRELGVPVLKTRQGSGAFLIHYCETSDAG